MPAAATSDATPPTLPTLLIVDDTSSAREVLRSLFAPICHVLEATTGEEALRLAATEPVDLVLLDVVLPDLDGLSVARRLRELHPEAHLPIVLVTAFADRAHRLAGLQAGVDDFIAKPFDLGEVELRVRAFLRSRALWVEREALRRTLEEVDARKDELAAILVHDLRNPLAGLLANLKLLEFEALTPDMKESVDGATAAADRLKALVDDLLDVRGLEAGVLRAIRAPTALRPLVDAVVRELSPMATAQGLSLVADPGADLTVDLDADLVRRALANLVVNALRYAPDGDTVRVGATADATKITCTVCDRSTGLPESEAPLLFGRFGATELRRRGARHDIGLGLHLARLVAEAHGGHALLTVDAAGTTLGIVLPRSQPV
ncbi:MAG: hybrid sensor histidine kinase/response regulator [Gemmatimonadota bacterium]|jgi:signal transduction histidine kinase|nr:hybrid sensor histidine kinase/response regulator [Gemmatimonadota bacterium]MDQ8156242.1 hybrid sensor histidine kinase/response regulator [Gemmatimonadota bacterium]